MEEDFSWFYKFLLRKLLFVFRQSMFFFILFIHIFVDYPLLFVYLISFGVSFVLELIQLIFILFFSPKNEEN